MGSPCRTEEPRLDKHQQEQKPLQIIVEIISVGVTVKKERREEDEATSSLLTLEPPRLLFVFNDISVAVLLRISVRDFGHSVQLLLLERGKKSFIQQRKRTFYRNELLRSRSVKHVL